MLNDIFKHIVNNQNKIESTAIHLEFGNGRKKLIEEKKWKRV